MIPFSILDLSPITEGSDAAQSFRNSLDLAQLGESLGFNRYWLAEHHGMPGIASAATAVLIAHIAAGTKTIRVGAGGIMLPHQAPTKPRRAPCAEHWSPTRMPSPTMYLSSWIIFHPSRDKLYAPFRVPG